MNRTVAQKLWRLWAALLVAAMVNNLRGQSRDRIIEEPQWFKARIDHAEAGLYSEGDYEVTDYRNTGQSITYDRFFIGPSIGLGMNGSIYHPYFFMFRGDGEGAFGWSQQDTISSTSTVHSQGLDAIGHFQASGDLFAQKPLSGRMFGSYSRGYRDYDFFTRVTYETWNYGANLSYNTPSVYLNAYYNHTDDTVLDPTLGSSYHQDTVGFQARNDRQSGTSAFAYTLSKYDTADLGATGRATDHSFALSDGERFGSHDQARLNTSFNYTRREEALAPSDQVDANANFAIDHTPTVTTAYNFSYDHYTSGSFGSDTYEGDATLRHRLYESLVTTLNVRGMDTESSDLLSSGYTRMFGGGIAFAYNKHLSPEHTLQLNNSIQIDDTEQKGVGTVVNELHTAGTPPDTFELNLPRVLTSTIVVMDAKRIRIYSPVIDYQVIVNGERTFISLLAGTTIPPNSVVSVDYRAVPSGQGEYVSISDYAGARLDLWRGLWGVYTRIGVAQNNAPADLHVQNLTSYTFGTDFHWHWFGAGAEYVIFDSDQTHYRSARLYQTANYVIDSKSAVGASAIEASTDYLDTHRHEEDYRFTSFYHRTMSRNFRFNFEAGVDVHRGEGVDQTLAALRPSIDYLIGRTSISLSYDYEYSLYLDSEERNKHLFTARLRRVF